MDTLAIRQVLDGLDVLCGGSGSEQNVMRAVLFGKIRLFLGRGGSNDIGALVVADLRVSHEHCMSCLPGKEGDRLHQQLLVPRPNHPF